MSDNTNKKYIIGPNFVSEEADTYSVAKIDRFDSQGKPTGVDVGLSFQRQMLMPLPDGGYAMQEVALASITISLETARKLHNLLGEAVKES